MGAEQLSAALASCAAAGQVACVRFTARYCHRCKRMTEQYKKLVREAWPRGRVRFLDVDFGRSRPLVAALKSDALAVGEEQLTSLPWVHLHGAGGERLHSFACGQKQVGLLAERIAAAVEETKWATAGLSAAS